MNIIKDFLASANSGEGFVEYFDYINDKSKNDFTFVLKGAPGSGKSTLMRRLGEYFFAKGYNVEFFHCSSDVSSLDGVRICELNTAVVDGTAPHVREAKIPLVDGKIVNLCDYANEREIARHRKIIQEQISKKQACFGVAYALIAAAKKIDNSFKFFGSSDGFSAEKILERLGLEKKSGQSVFNRKLFGSAVTSEGITNLINEGDFSVIAVEETSEENISGLIKAINALGYGVTEIMEVLNPRDRHERLIIEDARKIVRFEKRKPVSKEETDLRNEAENILKTAGRLLDEAKAYHKTVEEVYIQNMDFAGLDTCRESIISQIEQMRL